MPRSPRPRSARLYSSWNAHLQSHWGRRTWDALFLLAADFPHAQACTDDEAFSPAEVERKRRAWRRLFESLHEVLSCPECGRHFAAYLKRDGGQHFREALRDREHLFAWLHKCKDEVNKRTRRRSTSLERTRREYIAPCDPGTALKSRTSDVVMLRSRRSRRASRRRSRRYRSGNERQAEPET